jgi:glycerol kinase
MWLSIDQGGHASRAAVFDLRGEIVAYAEAPLSTERLGQRVEHASAELVASVRAAIAGVCAKLGSRASEIEAAGLATQRSTLVCARRSDGAALTPVVSWQDRRGAEDLARFADSAARIKTITGLQLSPHYGVGKIRWLRRHDGAVQQALAAGDVVAAPLASFVLHALGAGTAWQVDPANASRTLLMDMHTLQWSAELLELFAVPDTLLPEIRPSRFDYGRLDCNGVSIPLTVVSGDQSSALFCAGMPPAGTAFVNIGTGAFIQTVTGTRPIVDPSLLASIVWDSGVERLYVLEGTVNGAGAAIDAMLEPLGLSGPPPREKLPELLARIEDAPLFLNGVSGLGSPDWVADFPSRFVGAPASAELKLAAVYESIVFLILRNLQRMRGRVVISEIILSGGLARIDWIAQRLADLLALPVRRPRVQEATALGLAHLLAAGRLAGLERQAQTLFHPRSADGAVARYRRWTEALDAALAAR